MVEASEEAMKTEKRHAVENVCIRQDRLHLVVDSKAYAYELGKISERLANANKVQRETLIFLLAGMEFIGP